MTVSCKADSKPFSSLESCSFQFFCNQSLIFVTKKNKFRGSMDTPIGVYALGGWIWISITVLQECDKCSWEIVILVFFEKWYASLVVRWKTFVFKSCTVKLTGFLLHLLKNFCFFAATKWEQLEIIELNMHKWQHTFFVCNLFKRKWLHQTVLLSVSIVN